MRVNKVLKCEEVRGGLAGLLHELRGPTRHWCAARGLARRRRRRVERSNEVGEERVGRVERREAAEREQREGRELYRRRVELKRVGRGAVPVLLRRSSTRRRSRCSLHVFDNRLLCNIFQVALQGVQRIEFEIVKRVCIA